ncbi:PAS domain-containing sensor histidine kinase [Novispirillum itersonii]|uniref:histidine kinase n=1 Tax=Novispirillum itersonii TaxID=189 RepID=A0A7X0DNE3_NOVIT|nr:ATP-binding protein [Novispirillum itersonii]MBB6211279.1 PAS domain S-box-containing protein [Novispirillum itersonii]
MAVDIRTLLLVQAMTLTLALAVMVILYVRYRSFRGPGWWVSGAAAAAVSLLLMLGRSAVPADWFAHLGGLAVIVSYSLFYNGMRQFSGYRVEPWLPLAALVLSLLSPLLVPVFEPAQARGIVLSVALGTLSVSTGLTLLRGRHRPGEFGRRFTCMIWLLNGVMMFGRTVLLISDPAMADTSGLQNGVGAVLMWSVLFCFAMAAGPVLMTTEQLADNLARRTRDLESEIEERQMIQQRLSDSEAQFRRLIEAAPFPVLILHPPRGTILYINRLAAALFRAGPAELLDRPVEAFHQHPAAARSFVAEVTERGLVLDQEMLARDAQGTTLVLLVSAVRLPFHGQDCIMACANDITARKQLEQALEQARDDAETALDVQKRAMSEQRNFLAMVSHEFRTPLSIISSSADSLAALHPEEESRLTRINRAVLRMQGLIDTCLAHEWLESATQARRSDRVEIVPLLQRLAEEVRALHPDRVLDLDLSALAEESRCPDGPVITGDATLLSVVFSNLVENAVKYSPAPAPIRLEAAVERDDILTLRVSDSGIGITPEERERIFEKFFRSTRTERTPGAGLGLYLARQIIGAHDGDISLENPASGTGTVFRVCLPLAAPVPAQA